MKVHTKKKLFRRACKEQARNGRINNADGAWISRSGRDGSMVRDYYPQEGKR